MTIDMFGGAPPAPAPTTPRSIVEPGAVAPPWAKKASPEAAPAAPAPPPPVVTNAAAGSLGGALAAAPRGVTTTAVSAGSGLAPSSAVDDAPPTEANAELRAPFPWAGAKSRAAALIWEALGDVPCYVEPFAGSLATLLARPHAPRLETVNDWDPWISNFWRATGVDPAAVALHADHPVNECDLLARHRWLLAQTDFRERMRADPDYYDAKIAGWWVWGISQWISSGWCDERRAVEPKDQKPTRAAERDTNAAKRRDRKTGAHDKRPRCDGACEHGIHARLGYPDQKPAGGTPRSALLAVFEELRARLRRVRVCCGDWTRVLTPVVLRANGPTGILLDPPYDPGGGLDGNLYGTDEAKLSGEASIAHRVRAWAIEHGADTRLRIVYCGYEDGFAWPADWRCVPWKAQGGYGNKRRAGAAVDRTGGNNANRLRERLWLSAGCLRAKQAGLFDG